MSERKLSKVELTYDNGDVEWLESEEAEKWLQAAHGTAVMSAVHGSPFPQLAWQSKKVLTMTPEQLDGLKAEGKKLVSKVRQNLRHQIPKKKPGSR